MKKISILIICVLSLLLCIGCNNKEDILDEGKKTPSVNLIMISNSKYFTESEFIDEENGDDGYYNQIYKYNNINFTLERMEHKEYSQFPVYVEDKEIYDLECNDKKINDEMNMDISYPATKATYITKMDNVQIFNEDILISTDNWDFRIHLETNEENYKENSSIIDDIVKNIKIEEVN